MSLSLAARIAEMLALTVVNICTDGLCDGSASFRYSWFLTAAAYCVAAAETTASARLTDSSASAERACASSYAALSSA
eukprot:12613033-Alexandrium_andersonii.AAC.1